MDTRNKKGDVKRNDTIRLIILLAIVLIMVAVTVALIPQIKDLLTQEGGGTKRTNRLLRLLGNTCVYRHSDSPDSNCLHSW